MADRLALDLDVVTPLFLGGADPARPEVRASSFRGALRFWFRALAAQRDLNELRRLEAAVFGDTGDASSVLISADPVGESQPLEWGQVRRPAVGPLSPDHNLGLNYLAFAFRTQGGAPPRKCLPPGARIRLGLRLRRGADEDALRQAYAALWLLLNLGGLGTRARRGFGALAALSRVSLEGLPPLMMSGDSTAGLRRHLQEGLRQLREIVPSDPPERPGPYSILSRAHAGVFASNRTWGSWQAALGEIGHRLSVYRGGQPRDPTRNGLFPRMADLRGGTLTKAVAERAAFGLPIPYYDPRTRENFVLEPGAPGDTDAPDRRASPLLIKVVRLNPRTYTLVLTFFFGAAFLERGRTALHVNGMEIQGPSSLDPVRDFLQAQSRELELASVPLP